MADVIAVIVIMPFVMLGHVSGLLFGAFSRGFCEGRTTADALLMEVRQASDRKRTSKKE